MKNRSGLLQGSPFPFARACEDLSETVRVALSRGFSVEFPQISDRFSGTMMTARGLNDLPPRCAKMAPIADDAVSDVGSGQ